MFRLSSSDLLDAPLPVGRGAFSFRIWNGDSRTLAPVVRFNPRAVYGEFPGFDPADIPVPDPSFFGLHFRADLAITIATLQSVAIGSTGFNPDAGTLAPNVAWSSGTSIGIYTEGRTVAEGDTAMIGAIAQSTLPPADNDVNYSLTLPSGFTVTAVTISGLGFSGAADNQNPLTGEFVQTGTILKLYGAPGTYQPTPGSTVFIEGIFSVALDAPMGAIATYDMGTEEIDLIDQVDHLGMAFTPAPDTTAPQNGQFIYTAPYLSLFVPVTHLGVIQPASGGVGIATSFGAIVEYDEVVNFIDSGIVLTTQTGEQITTQTGEVITVEVITI
jgi:hypothetical protein